MYQDRVDAGQRLAKALASHRDQDVVVLALPRGGVVLGAEVARELRAPLGVVLVRKIGHPSHAEYAIGAVAEDEKPLYNEKELASIDDEWLRSAVTSARELIRKRRELYYDGFLPPDITGKTVILVDDGIATGLTMEAALLWVHNRKPLRVIVAVPVASLESAHTIPLQSDDFVVLEDPKDFRGAVGAHYQLFDQVTDEEVKTTLREVNHDIRKTTTSTR